MKFTKIFSAILCLIILITCIVFISDYFYFPKQIDSNKVTVDIVVPSGTDVDKVDIKITNKNRFPILLLSNSYNRTNETFTFDIPMGYTSIEPKSQEVLGEEFVILKKINSEQLLKEIEDSNLYFIFIPDSADTSDCEKLRIKPNCFIE